MKFDESELEPFKELLQDPKEKDYQAVLELLMEELFAERGCMWLERENAFIYSGDAELRKEFPFSRQAVDEVLDQGRSFICFDSSQDERVEPTGSIAMHKVRSCLSAACRDSEGQVLVLAYFDNGMSSGQFTERDLDFLTAVLSYVPGAVPVDS